MSTLKNPLKLHLYQVKRGRWPNGAHCPLLKKPQTKSGGLLSQKPKKCAFYLVFDTNYTLNHVINYIRHKTASPFIRFAPHFIDNIQMHTTFYLIFNVFLLRLLTLIGGKLLLSDVVCFSILLKFFLSAFGNCITSLFLNDVCL